MPEELPPPDLPDLPPPDLPDLPLLELEVKQSMRPREKSPLLLLLEPPPLLPDFELEDERGWQGVGGRVVGTSGGSTELGDWVGFGVCI